MRLILVTLLLTLFSTSKSWAHEFYFAYAEIAYNEMNQRFEGTLIFTTHDLERAIEPKGSLIGKFEKLDERSAELKLIEQYVNAHFRITYGCAMDSNAVDAICLSQFTLDGMVTQLNGTIECYISCAAPVLYNPISFQFDALMEAFANQQNKLTFIYRNQKETFSFLPSEPLQKFTLEPWRN